MYETHVYQLYEEITLHDGNVEAVFAGMADAHDNQEPASLGGGIKQYTFSKEWNDEDRFTVFPWFTGTMNQATGKISFFKCHPGAQKIMLLKQCNYLRIQTANALLRMLEAVDSFSQEADTFGTHTIPAGPFEFISRPEPKLFQEMAGVSLGEELIRNLLEEPAQWLPPLMALEDAWQSCGSLCLYIPNDLPDSVANEPFHSTYDLVEALRPFHLVMHNASIWNTVYAYPVHNMTFDLVPASEENGIDDSKNREAEIESIVEWCKVLSRVTDTEEECVFRITINTINHTGELMRLLRLYPTKLTFANFGTIRSGETGEVRPLYAENGKLFRQTPAYQHYIKKIAEELQSNEEFAKWISVMVSPPLLAGPYSCEVCARGRHL